MPTVVKEAIAAKAEADGVDDDREHKGRKKFDFTKVNAIIESAAARPVLDPRTPDEIIGCNAPGVPERLSSIRRR